MRGFGNSHTLAYTDIQSYEKKKIKVPHVQTRFGVTTQLLGCETRDRVTSLDKSPGAAILDFESVSTCNFSFFVVPKGKIKR